MRSLGVAGRAIHQGKRRADALRGRSPICTASPPLRTQKLALGSRVYRLAIYIILYLLMSRIEIAFVATPGTRYARFYAESFEAC